VQYFSGTGFQIELLIEYKSDKKQTDND